MNRFLSGQAGKTSRYRLMVIGALAAVPITAATVWWITPSAKPPDTTTQDRMMEVREAAAASQPLAVGVTVSLPGVEEWVNPVEGGAALRHRFTVLDFTTLW